MHLKEFSYNLPPELIAQEPLKKRDEARLMVVDRSNGSISHQQFSDINNFLPSNSFIVLNDSRVIPARLFGHRQSGGKVEIFLLKKLADGVSYEALLKPLGRLNVGEKILIEGDSGLTAELVDPIAKIVRFNKIQPEKLIEKLGHMPLPPYIKRADDQEDREFYQTVYSKNDGSLAAPTAGLHFTEKLLAELRKKHEIANITLHINYATFKPVQEENIVDHKMHSESFEIPPETQKLLEKEKTDGRKIVAVGTTACRVLETMAIDGKTKGETNIFIYPGYKFKNTDVLITNFHLPESTLLMLVYAFGGMDLMRRAYQEAIKEKYRFYSYGDAMVVI